MNTKLARPVLVESKEPNNIYTLDGKLYQTTPNTNIVVSKTNKLIPQQLILISLEDDKIEVGENCFDIESNQIIKAKWKSPHNCRKIIATQSQLPPEYIHQFIEEYNKGEVQDISIEMDDGVYRGELTQFRYTPKPKLTNGFATIVEKEPISYTEEEVRSFVFKAYNLRTFDGVVRSTNSLIDWFEQNKKK